MDGISRRTFVGSLASPTLALVRPGARVTIGCIGCGAFGLTLLRHLYSGGHSIAVAGLCDAVPSNVERARDVVRAGERSEPKTFSDYRELLAEAGVDAVVIAAPEHLHHGMLVEALATGKHVYLDGCLGQSPEETGRAIQAWHRSGRVVQIGLQNRSHALYRRARELVESGAIGRVGAVRASAQRPSPDRDPDWAAGCGTLSPAGWESFLGYAPPCALEHRRLYRWRNYWDYSAGLAADVVCHSVDAATYGLIRSAPAVCRATGGLYAWTNSDRELPDHFNVYYDYEDQFSVRLSVRLDAAEEASEEEFLGEEGSIVIRNGTSLTLYRQEPGALPYSAPRIRDFHLENPKAPGEALDAHLANFLEAVRDRQQALAVPSTAHGCIAATHLAAMSYRANLPAAWNRGRPRLVSV